MVPCDEGGLEACPYFKRECGSPGDTSENGCGLLPENVEALEFYPKWKTLGPPAFDLLRVEFDDEYESDTFANKLLVIDQYAPSIQKAQAEAQQEANPEQKKTARQNRRSKRRRG